MSVRIDRLGRGARTSRTFAGIAALSVLLGGCASLPISGPTGNQILKEQRDPATGLTFNLIPVVDFADLPVVADLPPVALDSQPIPPTDLIGPGDRLAISIYESGVPLFAPNGLSLNSATGGVEGAARLTNLPPMRVDDQGDIRFPFVGRMQAAGRTPVELQAAIRQALRGMSQNPHVVVAIAESLTNSVIIGGEVARAGRLVLQTNRETLGDAVSLAGGYRGDPKDLLVRIERRGGTQDFRLTDVMSGPGRDMLVRPGDRIDVIRQPLSFTVMGGAGRVDQLPFPTAAVSLAEAIALSGGANPNTGDAKAVFVFRLIPGADGKLVPTVYHINMMRAGSLFLSQRFPMQDKDVLYVGNAAFNQPAKMTQVLSQLFSPVLSVGATLNAVK